jgi:hypothetical protein
MSESDSNQFTSSSGSDSEDSDRSVQPVAPPGEGATLEHYEKVLILSPSSFCFDLLMVQLSQQYVEYLQLQRGKLQDRNATLTATNNVLQSNQLQRSRKRSPSQAPSSTVSSGSSAMTTTTTATDSDRASEKVIVDLGKKYGLTIEMFMLDDSIFKLPCPDPPADIQSARRYAKKSVEKDALVTELYGCIDHMLHPHMSTTYFINRVRIFISI